MKLFSTLLIMFFLGITSNSYAQKFIKRPSEMPLSFLEMQRQFDSWRKSVDLKKEKGWKYFKRFEMDMQYHTDAKGNPGDPALYINSITKAAAEKESNFGNRFTSVAWTPFGPNILPGNLTGYMENGIGRINCIEFHPTNPSTYFIGVAQGGLWKTTNNGTTWTPLTDNLPITRISDIEIDPSNPDIMYISVCDFKYIGVGLFLNGRKRNTHYGLGVYKTIDGGLTWAPTGLSFQLTDGDASLIAKTILHPTNSNKLVACGVSGMYSSNDAGVTWTKTLDSLFWDMIRVPGQPNVLYAASGWVKNANVGNAAIYKSNDFGDTWTMCSTGFPATGVIQRIKLAVAPSDTNYVYALTVDVSSGMEGLYRTTDAGATWNNINPGINLLDYNDGLGTGGQGNYDLALEINSTDKDIIYTGGINVWVSNDGALTFNPSMHWTLSYGPTIHGDIHFIKQQPSTGNIFVCSDGGLYRTPNIDGVSWNDVNAGSTWTTPWTNLCSGLQISAFYRLSSSHNTTNRVVAGAQDNATFYYNNGIWNTIFGGDGMDNCLDPNNNDVVIGSSQFGGFYYSIDNGISDNGWYPNVNGELGEWTTPVVADYSNPGTYYVGYENVVKTTDDGQTWNVISSFPPASFANNEISALAVSSSNPNVIYAAKRVRYEYSVPGSLYRTSNGGSTWLDVTAGIPDSLYYTSVNVHETNSNVAYISMAGFSAGNKIFTTNDLGASWQNISYNLPNIPVNCVKNIPNSGKLIAASDIGIYVLDSNSTTWTLQSNGLPNVIVSDIDFNTTLNKVYISTFGRGIWEADLSVLTAIATNENLQINATLYPSINNGNFNIVLNENDVELEVIDICGRLVYKSNLKGNQTHELALKLPSGKYFARLRNKNKSGVKSFIVE